MSTVGKILAAMGVLAVSTVQAASVLATVDSAEPFLIKGKRIPVTGISNWPAFNGDRIATTTGSALLSFRDGSYILLDKNTEVLLAGNAGKSSVRLLKGKLSYKVSEFGAVAFENMNKVARAGTLALEDGTLKALAETGLFVRLQARVDTAPPAGTYPIQINWNNPPPGVSTTPGPLPVSGYSGSH